MNTQGWSLGAAPAPAGIGSRRILDALPSTLLASIIM